MPKLKRKDIYIIAKDRLYFFSSQVTYLKNENRKKSRCVRTNGSIEYPDIKDFRYIGVKFEGYLRGIEELLHQELS